MKKSILLLAVTTITAGCAMTPADKAERDARLAIEQADFRLYQLPVRGMIIPGVEIPQRSMAAEVCGVQVLKGVGDTVRDREELQARKKRTDYAKRYNQLVLDACLKAKTR